MNSKDIAKKLKVSLPVEGSKPHMLIGKNNKKAIILTHGYTSWTRIMRETAEAYHAEGYDVFCPALKGHGDDTEKFIKAKSTDWIYDVEETLKNVSNRYKKVSMVGLSMGAAISTIVAAKYQDKVDKLVLLSPAFAAASKLIWLSPILQFFIKKLKKDVEFKDVSVDDPELQYMQEAYWKFNWTNPSFDLLRIMLKGRSALRQIKESQVDYYAFFALDDDAIDLDYTMNLFPDNKMFYFEDGGHEIIHKDGPQFDNVTKQSLSFLNG